MIILNDSGLQGLKSNQDCVQQLGFGFDIVEASVVFRCLEAGNKDQGDDVSSKLLRNDSQYLPSCTAEHPDDIRQANIKLSELNNTHFLNVLSY